jgi:gamma-glutamylcyclotransferase (GGCT)/AIG2-like uncharacterized protein YtfP
MRADLPLFVYGTLREGGRSHDLLNDAVALGPARTLPAFEMAVLGWYPALVGGGAVAVHGELYAVPPALWPILDEYEGCPGLYQRVVLTLDDGRPAQTYLLPAEHAAGRPRLAHGDWARRGS